MFSYWERESLLRYDHIIVGAGIVGLSLAIELRQLFPAHRILVLERGFFSTGASTRNAGFACMGSATELLDDLTTMSPADVVRLFAARTHGLRILRERLGDSKIGYQADGGYELLSDRELYALHELDKLNELLRPITGTETFLPANDKLSSFGFRGAYSKGLISNTCEAGINTGHMMRALQDLCMQHAIEIKTGVEVTGYEESAGGVSVHISMGNGAFACSLAGRTLSICTNAFTKQLLPAEDLQPGRGQVLITHPIPNLPFKGIFHMDCGYYYFREINGRVLFGGGRNLDFEGETSTEFTITNTIQHDLEQKLSQIILPDIPYSIDQRWAGIMAFGSTRQPIVKQVSGNVFGAFRMGGMGVALGSKVARDLAAIIQSVQ